MITVVLLGLIGFFAFSIYLGYRSAPAPAAKDKARVQTTDLELPEPAIPDPSSPTLIVLNGCGRAGLGARASHWLRRQGFDVFEVRNADRDNYERTCVVVRSSREDAAQKVLHRLQATLGIGLLVQQKVKVPEADVLLILGKDFPDSLPVF